MLSQHGCAADGTDCLLSISVAADPSADDGTASDLDDEAQSDLAFMVAQNTIALASPKDIQRRSKRPFSRTRTPAATTKSASQLTQQLPAG